MEILGGRIIKLNYMNWFMLGRMKGFGYSLSNKNNNQNLFKGRKMTRGRLIVDTYLASKEFLKEKDYSL